MDDDLEFFSQLIAHIQNLGFFNNFSVETGLALIIMLVLILFSAMISGTETAYFSIIPEKLKYENRKKEIDKKVLKLLEKPRILLATILITNNLIKVGIIVLGTFITKALINFEEFTVITVIIEIIILAALLLFIGEVLPRLYAAKSYFKFAKIMARPIIILRNIFSPLSTILDKSTRAVDSQMMKKTTGVTMDELNNAIEITKENAQTQEENEEQKILKGIAKFGDINVKEIMKSRVDVVSIEECKDYKKMLDIINRSGYSRIPVYRESFDNIQGIIYIKDLLGNLNEGKDFNWTTFIRPAYYVPENKKISDLLLEFQDKKIHLAIVVDEYGGTSGIVTMEDILEEIVGEIVDEFDNYEETVLYKKIRNKEYLFEGKVLLNDFCKTMNVDDSIFDNVRGNADTLAGFILEKLGNIPEKGSLVESENFTFVVQNVSDRRIKSVKAKVKDEN